MKGRERALPGRVLPTGIDPVHPLELSSGRLETRPIAPRPSQHPVEPDELGLEIGLPLVHRLLLDHLGRPRRVAWRPRSASRPPSQTPATARAYPSRADHQPHSGTCRQLIQRHRDRVPGSAAHPGEREKPPVARGDIGCGLEPENLAADLRLGSPESAPPQQPDSRASTLGIRARHAVDQRRIGLATRFRQASQQSELQQLVEPFPLLQGGTRPEPGQCRLEAASRSRRIAALAVHPDADAPTPGSAAD